MNKKNSKNDISQVFTCKGCNRLYVKPLILPCFRKICANCVNNATLNGEFTCSFCSQKHKTPEGGFPPDDELQQLSLKFYAKNEHRINLTQLKEDLTKSAFQLDARHKRLDDEVENHCNSIRDQVVRAFECKDRELNDLKGKYLNVIDAYQVRCLNRLKKAQPKIDDYKLELARFIRDDVDRSLQRLNVNQHECELALSKKNECEDFTRKLEHLTFVKRRLQFNPHNGPKQSVGRFTFTKTDNFLLLERCFILSGGGDNTLKVWNVETGRCTQTIPVSRTVFCVCVIDSSRIVSGCSDKTLKVWDVNQAKCVQTLRGHDDDVYCVSKIDNTTRIVSASSDTTLKVWDLNEAKCIRTLQGHGRNVYSVTTLTDKRTVVSASHDETLKVWNVETGECIRTFKGHTGGVVCVSAVDTKHIVSGGFDKTVKVWNLENGLCIQTFKGHHRGVTCVSVIDSCTIVSGSMDGTLIVWDLANGNCVACLRGHENSVQCVSLIDDSFIVSASRDKTLKVWNLINGRCVRTLKGHENIVFAVTLIDQ